VYLCVLYGSQNKQTAIISLYNINWLVFITETECVYCAVRTGSLHKRDCFVAEELQSAVRSAEQSAVRITHTHTHTHTHTQRVCKLQTLDACSVIYHDTQCSGLGFDSQEKAGHFLFSTLHTPAVRYNRQGIPEKGRSLPPRHSDRQANLTTHLHLPWRFRNVWSYTSISPYVVMTCFISTIPARSSSCTAARTVSMQCRSTTACCPADTMRAVPQRAVPLTPCATELTRWAPFKNYRI